MIPVIDCKSNEKDAILKKLLERSEGEREEAQKAVDGIVADVRKRGDEALFEYTKRFDGFESDSTNLKTTKDEIDEAYNSVKEKYGEELIQVLRRASDRIRRFHEKQKQNSWFDSSEEGTILGQIIAPVERCGVYVPGWKASYPSSVLMNVIPAKVAGVKRIIMTTPPDKNGKIDPVTLVAANEAGVSEIYKVGGAQAIAALAFGTESIAKVDKIVGPGNIYVALAKRSVYGYVNIDSVAGPSEILIIADKSANAEYVAADMLSQAEHGAASSAILITDDSAIAEAVATELVKQTNELEKFGRREIIEDSLLNYSAIIKTESIDEAVDIANLIAPEHLELCTEEPFSILTKIRNAGAVFMGNYSPEPLGDYMAGPNHVLPTGGTARFFSPLSVDDFVKKSSIISFSKESMTAISDDVIMFAEAEGLNAHANAVRIRKR